MDLKHFELLASYNKWMNSKVYSATARLSAAEISRHRGAFFGSIHGTLNHIVVGDTIWLKRFATHPSCKDSLREIAQLSTPNSLDQMLFPDFTDLADHRVWLDDQICGWIAGLSEHDLSYALAYRNTKGIPATKWYGSLILHFFNHQTHHRGQVSTLLSQAGEDVGVTDLLALIPDETQS